MPLSNHDYSGGKPPPFTSDARTIIIRGGPGTGKTSCLKERFVYLIKELQIPASSILVFAFSSASAKRFRRLLEREPILKHQDLHVHTFHSFATAVMKSGDWQEEMIHTPVFISPFKEYLVVKEILRLSKLRRNGVFGKVAEKDGFARELSDFFKLLKQNLLPPEKFAEIAGRLSPELSDLSDLYMAYEHFLQEKGYAGFSDIVIHAIGHLRRKSAGASSLGNFLHVLVDEFEEIDPAQLEFLKAILTKDISLFVAGNEEERVYGFRGSGLGRLAAIRQFREPVEEYILEKNHRLPRAILGVAAEFMGHRPAEVSQEESENAALQVIRHKDPIEQAYEIGRDIKRTLSAGEASSYSDFAVLCRSTSRSVLPLQEAFSYYNIPCTLYNPSGFYLHPLVRLLFDLITALVDPDDDVALEHALHTPALGLDVIELRKTINALTQASDLSLYESFQHFLAGPQEYLLSTSAFQEQLRKALTYISELRVRLQKGEALVSVVRSLMRDLFFANIFEKSQEEGIHDALCLGLFDKALGDIEDTLCELNSDYSPQMMIEYLEHGLAHFANQQENTRLDDDGGGVRIMTVHQAKGLEFPFVYIIDATNEYFPSLNRDTSLLNGRSLRLLGRSLQKNFDRSSFSSPYFRFMMSPKEHLEEERQLFHVAITRASRRLKINYTDESHLGESVEPSPFIDELLTGGERLSDAASKTESGDVFMELEKALNFEEIEDTLRRRVQSTTAKDIEPILTRLELLGLDGEYVCTEMPFEKESAEAPRIESHRFSASQLSRYLTCPRMFFYERMLRIIPERRREFDLGGLIHLVLEQLYKSRPVLGKSREALESHLFDIFYEIWNGTKSHEGTGFAIHFSPELVRTVVKKKAEDILRRYARTEIVKEGEVKAVTCEQRIEFDVRGLPFTAVIDRIDELRDGRGHRVVDYKTAQSGPMGAKTIKKLFLNLDEKEEYTPEDFQMPLYYFAARAAGYKPVELVYYWVAQEDAKGMFKKSMLRVGEEEDCLRCEELIAVEDAILKAAARILAGDFSPQPRTKYECRRCPFERICDK